MRISSLARYEHLNCRAHLWKRVSNTLLAAIGVALMTAGCKGTEPGGSAMWSGTAAKAVSNPAVPPSPGPAQYEINKALGLFAYFDSASADGCVDTSVIVNGFSESGWVIPDGGPPHIDVQQHLGVFVRVGDSCRNVLETSAYGDNHQLTLQLSPDLSSGRVTGIVTLTDIINASTFDVRVDVTWTGTGEKSRTVSKHSAVSGGVINTDFNGFSRGAIASGTLVSNSTCDIHTCQAGPPTNLTPVTSTSNFNEMSSWGPD
jgi:hypothetical protein